MDVWTQNVNATLTLSKAGVNPVLKVSAFAQGGTIGVTGLMSFNGQPSEEIVLAEGQGFVLEAGTKGIDLIIRPITGTAATMILFN